MKHLRIGLLATAAVALVASLSPASAQVSYNLYGGEGSVINDGYNGDPNYFVTGEPGETSGCSPTCYFSGLWAGQNSTIFTPSPFGSSSQDNEGGAMTGANVIANGDGYVTMAAYDHNGPGGADEYSGLYISPTSITLDTPNVDFVNPYGGYSNLTVGTLTATNGAVITGGATIDTLGVTGTETVGGLLTANGGLLVNGGATINGGETVNGGDTVHGGLTSYGGAALYSGATGGNYVIVNGTGVTEYGNGATETLNGVNASLLNSNGRGVVVNGTTTTLTGGGNGGATSTVTLTAGQASVLTQDGKGLTVNNGGAVTVLGGPAENSGLTIGANGTDVAVTNSDGFSGMKTSATATTMSGGSSATTSSDLTLNDGGAFFGNHTTGAPIRVTGVADGKTRWDAVNFGQLRSTIALGAAFAGMPQVDESKTFAVALGTGYFDGSPAGAVGASFRPRDDVVVKVGVGFGQVGTAVNGGVGFSW